MKDTFMKAMSASTGVALIYAAAQVLLFSADQKSTQKIKEVISATAPVAEDVPLK